jgi:tRNA (cytidine32/uridine32-2'-O)-methyltransferase
VQDGPEAHLGLGAWVVLTGMSSTDLGQGFRDPRPRIRFVLVNTSHPGNIGAAARAMKTMGLRQLYLVNPKTPLNAEATARASGANDVLVAATVCHKLDEALGDCVLICGTSARSRHLPWPQLEPREAAREVARQAGCGAVAVVFGGEHSGLSNTELERCHFLVSIPTGEEYRSLNLAAAVQVIAYEILLAARVPMTGEGPHADYATAQEMEQLYAHLRKTLVSIGFLDPANPRHLMRRLKRLLVRARPDKVEVSILRGILTAAQRLVQPARALGDKGNDVE